MVKLLILVADGDKRLNVTHVTHTLGILKAKGYDYIMYLFQCLIELFHILTVAMLH